MDTSDFGTFKVSFFHWLFLYILHSRRLHKYFSRFLCLRFPSSIDGPFDIYCKYGLRFRVYMRDNLCDRVLLRRGVLADDSDVKFLIPYIFSGMTFLDIGANIGYYSCFVNKYSNCNFRLLAFEPHPVSYTHLLYNLSLNGIDASNVLNCALGSSIGKMDLWCDDINAGCNSLLPSSRASSKTQVSVFRLLDICVERNIDKIDLLKIDVEGYEYEVLHHFFTNAPSSLFPSIMFVEVSLTDIGSQDLLNLFSLHGYSVIYSSSSNVIFQHKGSVISE